MSVGTEEAGKDQIFIPSPSLGVEKRREAEKKRKVSWNETRIDVERRSGRKEICCEPEKSPDAASFYTSNK